MTVIAIAKAGQEFLYKSDTAHKVNEKKADAIIKALNEIKYNLNDGEIWHKYSVSTYDRAGVFAECQKFIAGKNGIKRITY